MEGKKTDSFLEGAAGPAKRIATLKKTAAQETGAAETGSAAQAASKTAEAREVI